MKKTDVKAQMEMVNIMQEVDDMKDKMNLLLKQWLEKHGWENTSSSTPSSRWLWVKEIEGRTLMLDRDLAIEVQQRITGCPACGSGELYNERGIEACVSCGWDEKEEI